MLCDFYIGCGVVILIVFGFIIKIIIESKPYNMENEKMFSTEK